MFKNIICPSCGRVNQINNVRKYLGKKVRLNCLNTGCGKEIIMDLNEESVEDKTIVVRKNESVINSGKLVYKNPNNDLSVFVLSKNENLAGRSNSSFKPDIEIKDDPYFSRKQFIIKVINISGTSGQFNYILTDCNSKNKTILNGKALEMNEEIFLNDHDIIQAGNSTFEFIVNA